MFKVSRLVVTKGCGFTCKKGGVAFKKYLELLSKKRKSIDILVTPGGFLQGQLPDGIETGWNSNRKDFNHIIESAQDVVYTFFTKKILALSKGRIRYVTLGVDLHERNSSLSQNKHAELVCVFDCTNGEVIQWTGKSYPTRSQENSLYYIRDYSTHFLKLDTKKIMILGCHDLNIFSPRGYANQKPGSNRRKAVDKFRREAKKYNPNFVFQHPHTTDTPNIWRLGWSGIKTQLPNVSGYCSGVCYFNKPRERGSLESVLKSTQWGLETLDIKINYKQI